MDSQATHPLGLNEILLKLIEAGIWSTRERLGYKWAIHTLDNESSALPTQPYSTNLDLQFEILANQYGDLLDQIADYIARNIVQPDPWRKLVAPEAFQAKRYTLGTLHRIMSRLNYELVPADQVAGCENLILLAGSHSQAMVDFWRQHEQRIGSVVTLFGTTRKHIAEDLRLPAAKYMALASRDTLAQIGPDERKIMIPGVRKAPVDGVSSAPSSHPLLPLAVAPPVAPFQSDVSQQLLDLKDWVRRITFPGEFLLSVNKFSDSWLYIARFNRKEVRDLVAPMLRHVLTRYLESPSDPYVLFCSELGSFSEDEFATADVVHRVFAELGDARLSFERYWEPEPGVIQLNEQAFQGLRAIGVFVLSIHVDLLLSIIAKIREIGGDVAFLIAIIERDDVGRAKFAAQGVDLVPLVLWDADKKELRTVLERSDPIYTPYHALFL
ncbi:hypothetical protein K2Z83_11110 [Oscillochloris sp. ZM17-4]|uniref:hypothetical protein n=1 Tax=Oscillochloris sp. ZM17-4 TaxID=2866714 RepID=UPI001C735C64|nr:hypothetical protein [Oscillochloris sp. ZM17-4]MBX0328225.1 hypothetical protein [Oscillochloris sp. ZM17-4]